MRGTRIPGSGGLARTTTWVVSGILLVLVVVTWGARPAGVLLELPAWHAVEVVVLVVAAIASARAALLGVRMLDDRVVVRSWLRTRGIPYAELEAIDLLGYVGLRAQGDLPAFVLTPGWRLAEHEQPIAPQGLAATPDAQRRQVQAMREHVQALPASVRPAWLPVAGTLVAPAARRVDRAR